MTGEEFRSVRKYLQLSQKGLAEQLGYTRRAVGNWETGLRNVPRPAELLLGFLKRDRDIEVIHQSPKQSKVVFPPSAPPRSLGDAAANPSKYS